MKNNHKHLHKFISIELIIPSRQTQKKNLEFLLSSSHQAPTRFELVIEVLQTFALPLGHGAIYALLSQHIYYNKFLFFSQSFKCYDFFHNYFIALRFHRMHRFHQLPVIAARHNWHCRE